MWTAKVSPGFALSTNTGPRTGILIGLASLLGWMTIMGMIWWMYSGSPASLGGMDLRRKPGAPGYAEVDRIPVQADLLLAVLGPEIPTRSVIRDPKRIAAINRVGGTCVDAFSTAPTLDRLFDLGARFAEETGLANKTVLEVIRASRMFGRATMAMLGNAVFASGNREQLATLYLKFGTLQRCEVDNEGARVL